MKLDCFLYIFENYTKTRQKLDINKWKIQKFKGIFQFSLFPPIIATH